VLNYVNNIIIIILSFVVLGCDFIYLDEEPEIVGIKHTVYEGQQSDILYQRFEVFNRSETFQEFLFTLPSLNGDVPSFNEEQETMIVMTARAVPCVFAPEVVGVKRENSMGNRTAITVHVQSVSDENPSDGTCEPNDQPVYRIFFVSIDKTGENISTEIRYWPLGSLI